MARARLARKGDGDFAGTWESLVVGHELVGGQ